MRWIFPWWKTVIIFPAKYIVNEETVPLDFYSHEWVEIRGYEIPSQTYEILNLDGNGKENTIVFIQKNPFGKVRCFWYDDQGNKHNETIYHIVTEFPKLHSDGILASKRIKY